MVLSLPPLNAPEPPVKEGEENRPGSSVADDIDRGRPLSAGPGWLAVTVSELGGNKCVDMIPIAVSLIARQ
jgi:hypothetical protein